MCTGNGRAGHLHRRGPADGGRDGWLLPLAAPGTADSRADRPAAAISDVSRRERDGAPEPTTQSGRHRATGETHDGAARGEARDGAAQPQVVTIAERDRVSAELHDIIERRLFAAGLSLHRAAGRLRTAAAPEATSVTADHIDQAIAVLDEVVDAVRAMIDHGHVPGCWSDLPCRLRDVVTDTTAVLGFTPSMWMSEALASSVMADVGDDLVIALRETLATVVRGTSARSVAVSIGIERRCLTLTMVDDGVGQSAAERRRLLAGLRMRAERRAGALQIDARYSTGRRMAEVRTVWSVPT